MIFILTFNLVVVSGLRTDKVMELARERLSNIGMGFAVCVFTNMLIFPIWASDELHYSIASKFETLACYIEEKLVAYDDQNPSSALRQSIREPCEVVGSSLAWTLRDIGESLMKMERCRPKAFMAPKLQSMKQELSLVTYSKLGAAENGEGLAMASLVFLLKKMTTLFLLE
ncbi:hypothetical protein HYC85_019462 [Camellia sinensis]|uniref:Uncharacterized protein n=1 Tax=Camellia sinensis TaxID=4442 RepID=A0A7J7GM84_CAMSI|nr:hypothetical protein HYC85_019462 [Camellia sinensis]